MSKKITLTEGIVGLFIVFWLALSFLIGKSSPLGLACGIILLVGLKFTNRTVQLGAFFLGVIAFATAMMFQDVFIPNMQTHEAYFGFPMLSGHGFAQVYNAITAWSFSKTTNIVIVPTIIFALCFVSLGQAALYALGLISQTAEEKLLKHSARNKPREAKAYNFSELKKVGYDSEVVPLGVNLWEKSGKQPIGVPFNVLNRHIMLVGTTGAGKTTTLYHFIVSALAHDKPIVFVDGKGAADNIDLFCKWCDSANRKVHVVTLDGKTGYNPVAVGTLDEIRDKLIGMFDWSEDHYRLGASRFIRLLLEIMQLTDIPVNMGNIVDYADYNKLSEHVLRHTQSKATAPSAVAPTKPAKLFSGAPPTPSALGELGQTAPSEVSKLMTKLKSVDPKSISGFRDRLASLVEGDTARMFTAANSLNLSKAIEAGEAVLFSLDSLRYPELATQFGRLVTNDVKSCVSVHAELAFSRNEKPQRVTMIFDEFNVFASRQVVDIINKSRSAGFEVLLSFQSLSDIDRLEKGPELRKQIIENCNSMIIQREKEQEGRETLAKTFGTRDSVKLTIQEDDAGGAGAGSLREVQEFIVSPNDIRNLETGQAFVDIDTVGITKIQIPLQEQIL